ncbi:MAG TPA: TlpA disulfide reductase family protein [Burkholderiales bacterium]|nr:TlpA disulfide reductase family protein [Burkholderiales bacterium]
MITRSFQIALICFSLMLLAGNGHTAVDIDAPAPALKGQFFSGQSFDLTEMRGKVVLINFYSSYCKFCAYEIGNIETYLENNRDKGFTVIMIGVDQLEDRHRMERMMGIYNLDGLMTDELEQSGFEKRYATPTTFVVDRKGILRSRSRGAKMPAWFREHIDPLLTESQ